MFSLFCNMFKNVCGALASLAWWVGASSRAPKGCGFNYRSGHIPGLHVQSPFWAPAGGNQSMFLSHINLSL